MKQENIYDEFEVSFNFENVLYVCQVKLEGDPYDSFYKVEYFSPNGKGSLNKLAAHSPSNGTEHQLQWYAAGAKENPFFVQAIGEAIEKRK
ncbi:MAG TPA: hypothetical protein VNV85_08200 [Puia sp.]|jgi:hypothetical protein|nr:hypothetical protein [Puia sp.]